MMDDIHDWCDQVTVEVLVARVERNVMNERCYRFDQVFASTTHHLSQPIHTINHHIT